MNNNPSNAISNYDDECQQSRLGGNILVIKLNSWAGIYNYSFHRFQTLQGNSSQNPCTSHIRKDGRKNVREDGNKYRGAWKKQNVVTEDNCTRDPIALSMYNDRNVTNKCSEFQRMITYSWAFNLVVLFEWILCVQYELCTIVTTFAML